MKKTIKDTLEDDNDEFIKRNLPSGETKSPQFTARRSNNSRTSIASSNPNMETEQARLQGLSKVIRQASGAAKIRAKQEA
jgi:hypothetical protein